MENIDLRSLSRPQGDILVLLNSWFIAFSLFGSLMADIQTEFGRHRFSVTRRVDVVGGNDVRKGDVAEVKGANSHARNLTTVEKSGVD